MKKTLRFLLLQLVLYSAVTGAFAPHRAAADVLYPPSGADANTIFFATAFGYPWAVYVNSNWSACAFQLLGDQNGLDRDWTVFGTEYHNRIYFVNSSTNSPNCGLYTTWTPIQFNGHALSVHGEGTDDFIVGSGFGSFLADIHGGTGEDVLVTMYEGWYPGDSGSAYGEDHNDTFFAYAPSTRMYGQSHHDTFCVTSWTTAEFVDGGDGWDRLCGSASEVYGVEFACEGRCTSLPF